MPMYGHTRCAVPNCTKPIHGFYNLCDEHRLPGAVVQVDDSTMVITCWMAEHGDEVGIIILNGWALGAHFGGRAGFEAQLAEQGFVNVRNLATPGELETAKQPAKGKKFGDWGGPWWTQYPWEKSRGHGQPN